MSSKYTVCGVCSYQHINKQSVVWCSECDEGLCEKCKVHHTASKGSRNHSIVQISEYLKLPSNLLEVTQTCSKHDEKYQIFCKKHDIPCCRRCVVETHNDCKDLNAIEDVIKNVKSSNAFLEMEQVLKELSEHLQNIRKDRQENIKSLRENRGNIEQEVQQTRILINNHLDKIQESMTKELFTAEEKENKKINNLISSIQEKEKEITECQTTLDKMKQHASDLQTFLAMKHIQRDVRNNEQFIESLIKEEKMDHISITWENKNAVDTIHTTINRMGTIKLETRPSEAILTSRKLKQAQIMVSTTLVPTIDDVKLTLRQTVNTIGRDITDCSLLSDSRMIFSCFSSGQISVIKSDGTLDFTVKPAKRISHIYFIEESQKLVATAANDNSFEFILIIDMTHGKTVKSIEVGSENYGIVHKNGKLYFNGHTGGLRVASLDGNSVKQLVNVTLKEYSSIAIWSDQLYFISEEETVSCCDLQGGFKWKLEHKTCLSDARGITVDNYGHIYVSGFWSHNVVVISSDGNKHRLLLSEKDGLQRPQSLYFDLKNNKLLIANQQTNAFVYDVSK